MRAYGWVGQAHLPLPLFFCSGRRLAREAGVNAGGQKGRGSGGGNFCPPAVLRQQNFNGSAIFAEKMFELFCKGTAMLNEVGDLPVATTHFASQIGLFDYQGESSSQSF